MKVDLATYERHINAIKALGYTLYETSADYHSGYDFETYLFVGNKRVVIADCHPQMRTCDYYIFDVSDKLKQAV
jgi:hypothetical protein